MNTKRVNKKLSIGRGCGLLVRTMALITCVGFALPLAIAQTAPKGGGGGPGPKAGPGAAKGPAGKAGPGAKAQFPVAPGVTPRRPGEKPAPGAKTPQQQAEPASSTARPVPPGVTPRRPGEFDPASKQTDQQKQKTLSKPKSKTGGAQADPLDATGKRATQQRRELGAKFQGGVQIDEDTRLGMSVEVQGDQLRITDIEADQFAEAAGLAVGDVVQSVGGRTVRTQADFVAALRSAMRRPGPVAIGILRNGQPSTVNFSAFGLRFGVGLAGTEPVRVTSVLPGSIAANSGLAVGDEVVTVNGRPVSSDEEVESLLGDGTGGGSLQVRRNGQLQNIQLQPGGGGTTGGGALGRALDQTLGRLDDLRGTLGDLADDLGPVGEELVSLLDSVIGDLEGLDDLSGPDAERLLSEARQALRDLQNRLGELASTAGSGTPQGGALQGASSAAMGLQTDLDSLSSALKTSRPSQEPALKKPRTNLTELSDLLARLHLELMVTARSHAGPTRAALERVDAQVVPLMEGVDRVASSKPDMAHDFSELRDAIRAIRADLEAIELAPRDRAQVEMLLALVRQVEEKVPAAKGKE